MVQALVMLGVVRGAVHQTAERLLAIDGVAEVYSVSGNFDLVAVLRCKEYEQIAQIVTEHIAAIDQITRTETMMAFKVYSSADIEQGFEIGVD